MKRLLRPAVLAAAVILAAGCASKAKPAAQAAAAPTAAAVATPTNDAMATLATMASTAEPAPATVKKLSIPWYMTVISLPTKVFTLLPKKKRPPQAQPPRLIGVVKMVNTQDGFVLIDAVTQSASHGDLLICINAQKETANLRMSNLKNPPFLIADIASGSPAPGDRVFIP